MSQRTLTIDKDVPNKFHPHLSDQKTVSITMNVHIDETGSVNISVRPDAYGFTLSKEDAQLLALFLSAPPSETKE